MNSSRCSAGSARRPDRDKTTRYMSYMHKPCLSWVHVNTSHTGTKGILYGYMIDKVSGWIKCLMRHSYCHSHAFMPDHDERSKFLMKCSYCHSHVFIIVCYTCTVT